MILRWSSSHARSHSSCAPIKTTQMLLPSYNKKKQSFVVCFCVSACVSWKKQAARAVLRMRTLSRVFLSDYVDVFPKKGF